MDRRTFLSYGGGVIAGITLGEFGRRQLAKIDARAATWRGPGRVTWATTVCRECAAGCTVRVRLVDDVPVNLQGNPFCPVAQGRLCAKGQAALEGYFDPDRLVGPVKRVGKRGENRWEPIEWPAAVALLSAEVTRLSTSREAMLALAFEAQGPIASAWGRFWQSAGARVAWEPASNAARLRPNFTAMTGVDADPLFDFQKASYVVSFGAPLVEEWLSPVWTQRSYGAFRHAAWGARGRLVQVDGRYSLTARKADEWLAVPAERQISLAYHIASALVRGGLLDRENLEEAGGNVADFAREVTLEYPPDGLDAATGVPVDTVSRLARELATTAHPLVVVAADAPSVLVDAVMALNGLLGAFDRQGGISAPQVPSTLAPFESATVALQEVVNGKYAPRLVAFRDVSALRALSSPTTIASALKDASLIVSFSPYLDEAAANADLVMPAHTPLESWHAFVPSSVVLAEAAALARPAVEPRLKTRDIVTILGETATAVGGVVAEACADCRSSEDLVTAELDRLWGLSRGAPYSSFQETDERFERRRVAVHAVSTREEFGVAVLGSGGWVDPYLDPGRIKESVRKQGGLKFTLPDSAPVAVPVVATPSGQPPPAEASSGTVAQVADKGYSLRLLAFAPAVISQVGSPNQPGVMELLGPPDTTPWRPWADMHPAVAAAAGVTDGSIVLITSQHGAVRMLVRIVPDMPRDTVAVACVPAMGNGGRWAGLLNGDARQLLGPQGTTAPTAVRVSRE